MRDRPRQNKAQRDPAKRVDEKAVNRQVWQLVEPVCSSEGLELVCVEFQRESGGRILRLYIDRPDGVSLDDCVALSRQVGDLLDVCLSDFGPYRLEVSSPGAQRPLAKAEDFQRFAGHRARIRVHSPVAGQKTFSGTLLGIHGGLIDMDTIQGPVVIPWDAVRRAHLLER